MLTRLLVPLDGSPLSEQALGRAAEIARVCNATVDIVLVHHALQDTEFADMRQLDATQLQGEEKYVRDIAVKLTRGTGVATTHGVLTGAVVASIIDRATSTSANLVVMTSHGRTGLSRAWLGSVADGVIRHSSIPVLMLRPARGTPSFFMPGPFRKILVPVDGSPESFGVLDTAASLARSMEAQVVLVCVVRPVPIVTFDASIAGVYPAMLPDDVATAHVVGEKQRQLAEAARFLTEREGLEVAQHVLVADNVVEAVLDLASAASADLIAMSTHGRGPSRLLIGSVADKILRGSARPVLLHHGVQVPVASPFTPAIETHRTPLVNIA